MKPETELNEEVTIFLDKLNHPLRKEIDSLRSLILSSNNLLKENIKWNGPNYSWCGNDRITMRIQPPKQIQIIFHRGAKKLQQPQNRLINDETSFLKWKENDRAIVSFKSFDEIENSRTILQKVVSDWIEATMN
ncbi:MAG TPA: DUF1801 domain-containing protein [Draconibacterium sp.]|nr:DUF1801 domain-containing protein [Draconibacterium sp.]